MTQQSVPVTSDVPQIAAFAATVADLISQGLDEQALTTAVQRELTTLLAVGFELPAAQRAPDPER